MEDKSLGCTQKSGVAPVVGVLKYAEQVKTKGLNLLSAPGNDLVASTALAVSGAQIVLFTTGRGTPFASLVPTVKIASNSKLSGFHVLKCLLMWDELSCIERHFVLFEMHSLFFTCTFSKPCYNKLE